VRAGQLCKYGALWSTPQTASQELVRVQRNLLAGDRLLVQALGVRGSGRDVGVTGSLVGASGELEGIGSRKVVVAGDLVGVVVLLEVEATVDVKEGSNHLKHEYNHTAWCT
jgi:hypothetical protein